MMDIAANDDDKRMVELIDKYEDERIARIAKRYVSVALFAGFLGGFFTGGGLVAYMQMVLR